VRRWIAGAAAGLGLLLAAPVARADGPQWNGSRLTTPTAVGSESFVITAQFVRTQTLTGGTLYTTTNFTTPSGLLPQCGAPGTTALSTAWEGAPDKPNAYNTSATHSVECNGTYSFEVVATFKRPLQPDDVKKLPGTITVAAPPPDVETVNHEIQGSSVALSWSPVSNKPADFTGYRIERQDASGTYTTIGTAGPNSTTFTDTSPPPEGGEVVYRVRALRSGPNGDIPSEGGGRESVDVPVATSTTAPGTDGGATTGGATDGATAGADGGATTGGTSGGTTGGATSTPRFSTSRGRTGVGTRAPRLGVDSGSGSGLLLEPPDEGFDEEIDYGELPGEDGEEAGDLEVFDEGTGRGLAVPIGIGAVLAGWGLHLFFLARAARPVTMAVPVLDETYDLYDHDDLYDEPAPTSGYGSTGYGSTGYGGSSYGTRYGTAYPSTSYNAYDDYDDSY
jgi:hypothetical protein